MDVSRKLFKTIVSKSCKSKYSSEFCCLPIKHVKASVFLPSFNLSRDYHTDWNLDSHAVNQHIYMYIDMYTHIYEIEPLSYQEASKPLAIN